jgi:DNA-binding IclR family transcriptional regulator
MQDAILEFLFDYKRSQDGNSPTYQEIADALGKRPANVYRYVQSMCARGLIRLNHRGKIVVVGGKYITPDDDDFSRW